MMALRQCLFDQKIFLPNFLLNWDRRFHMNVGEKSSHLGELARLTGPAHLHVNSPLVASGLLDEILRV